MIVEEDDRDEVTGADLDTLEDADEDGDTLLESSALPEDDAQADPVIVSE